MRALWIVLLSLGVTGSPAIAATLNPSTTQYTPQAGAAANLFNITLNLVQQWTMPITVNQAIAIGINSSNISAAAETNVISLNETTIFTGTVSGLGPSATLADVPWLSQLLGKAGVAMPQLAAGLPAAGGGEAPAPVPVPPALPLMFAALGALGWMGRRARKVVPA